MRRGVPVRRLRPSTRFRRLRNMGWASIGGGGYTENEGVRKTGGDMNGQKETYAVGFRLGNHHRQGVEQTGYEVN